MISSVFRKTDKIKNPHSEDFPFLYGSPAEETKGFLANHDFLCLQRKKARSLRMIDTLFSDRRSKIILKQGDSSAYKPPLISSYYQYLLRSPWSDIRLTTISAMSYMPYFIAFMHRFYCTFCAHFFHNSEFQQIIVVICSFSLLLFLE